jgi:hypothetical protein
MSSFNKTGGSYGVHSGSGRFKNLQVDDTLYVRGATIGPSIPGNVWYVDLNVGASGRGGSWSTAFKTIQEAVDASGDGTGDFIFVGPGKYQENVLIKDHSALHIIALAQGWETRIRASDATTKLAYTPSGGSAVPGVCFAVLSRSVEICGFNLDSGGGYAGIYVGDGYVIDNEYDENSASAIIHGNLFAGGTEGLYGLTLDGCSDAVIIENNIISQHTTAGIYLSPGGTRTCQRPFISRNEFVGNAGYGILLADANTTVNVLVRENSFMDRTAGTAMTRSCLFQGTGAHTFVGNYDASANGAAGSATDFMAGNSEAHAMNSPVYLSEA